MNGLVEATQIISIIVFLGTTVGFFIKIGEYKSIINTKLTMLEKNIDDLKDELKETNEEMDKRFKDAQSDIDNRFKDTKDDIDKLKTETTFVTSRLETLLIEVKTKLELLMQFQGVTNQNAKPKN